LSSKFYSRISLAVISISRLKQSIINCPRCSFRLCVIQFTRYRRYCLAVSLLILSRCFPIVKHYFPKNYIFFIIVFCLTYCPCNMWKPRIFNRFTQLFDSLKRLPQNTTVAFVKFRLLF